MQQATYYDGKSARPRPVRIGPRPSGEGALRIYDLEDRMLYWDWPVPEIITCASLKDSPLQLRRSKDTGERLVVDDLAARQFMISCLEPQLKERKLRKIRNWGVGTGVVWLLIALLWFNMNTVLSVALNVIPESWEGSLGHESREQLARILALKPTGPIPWCTGEGGVKALNLLTVRLGMTPVELDESSESGNGGLNEEPKYGGAGDISEQPGAVEVTVLKASLPNAFSLPGRRIVITSAMIDEADNPEQLAGVLAHEMGHLTERHSAKRMIRAYGIGLFFQLVAGQGELFNSLGGLGNVLIENKFSREDEALADRLAVRRMAAAALNPVALADLFAKFQDKESKERDKSITSPMWEYFSDHPDFDKRIAEIRALTEETKMPAAVSAPPVLNAQEWTDLRNICVEE